jgi:hypothetical protein
MSIDKLVGAGLFVVIFGGLLFELFSHPPTVRRKHPNPDEAKRKYKERTEKKGDVS